MENLLSKYTIIDWSSHLPGPYACHLLAQMGAKVIKLVPENNQMPFQKFPVNGPLALFEKWYEQFNKHKEIIHYTDIRDVLETTDEANGIITNRDHAFMEHFIVTKIEASSQNSNPKHDLNALAESGFLSHHIHLFAKDNDQTLSPPTLPWAGVLFGHDIARTHLAQLLSGNKEQTVYLDESFKKLKQDLLPMGAQEFLHSGAFPSYRLYKLGDGSWVALAAIESKFWMAFSHHYSLDLDINERFDETGRVIKKLASFFQTLELKDLENGQAFCLSAIES